MTFRDGAMKGCGQHDRVHRYRDGELAPAERAAMEAHLHECAACRQTLVDLLCLSALITDAPVAKMPAEALGRFQSCWPRARDRGVIRAAGWLTAAAATILIGVLLTRFTQHGNALGQPPIWQTVAVMSPLDTDDDIDSETLVVALWMADDLSPAERR